MNLHKPKIMTFFLKVSGGNLESNITFEDVNVDNAEQAAEYVKWFSDEVMLENWYRKKPDSNLADVTTKDFKEHFDEKQSDNKLEQYVFMVKMDGVYIGYGQIFINHPVAMTKGKRISWPCIAVGNSLYRSKGIGVIICQKIFELSKIHKCDVIEAGIFEFNTPMKQILIKNGFQFIGNKEKITFTQGRWWNAEHYLLNL